MPGSGSQCTAGLGFPSFPACTNLPAGGVLGKQLLIVVEGNEDLFQTEVAQFERAGWLLHAGWDPPVARQDQDATAYACFGSVRSRRDAEGALLAALRGFALVAHVTRANGEAATFVDDLRRIGSVEIRDDDESGRILESDERALLGLIADGSTVAAATAALHISLRTGQRRLERARVAVGARTTAEAVHVARSLGLC